MVTDPVDSESPARAGDQQTRLEALIRQHRELDEQLREMSRRRGLSAAEEMEAAMMKKRKLWLKDQIAALSSSG